MRSLHGLITLGILVIFAVGALFNIYVFTDCLADGKRAYQCNAAMQNPVYVGVDEWN